MKTEIKEHRKNPLMKRDEYMIRVDHSGKPTPSRQELIKEFAKELKVAEDVIIIDKILSKAGSQVSEARTHVYKKKAEIPADKLEKMAKRMKTATKETEKPAETAAEAPATEKPAEEAKPAEEKPAEATEEAAESKPAEEVKEESKADGTATEKPAEAAKEEKSE